MLLPKPVQIHSRILIYGENDGGEDEPVDVEVEDKQEDKSSDTPEGSEDRGRKKKVGVDLFHSSFLLGTGRNFKQYVADFIRA